MNEQVIWPTVVVEESIIPFVTWFKLRKERKELHALCLIYESQGYVFGEIMETLWKELVFRNCFRSKRKIKHIYVEGKR